MGPRLPVTSSSNSYNLSTIVEEKANHTALGVVKLVQLGGRVRMFYSCCSCNFNGIKRALCLDRNNEEKVEESDKRK